MRFEPKPEKRVNTASLDKRVRALEGWAEDCKAFTPEQESVLIGYIRTVGGFLGIASAVALVVILLLAHN